MAELVDAPCWSIFFLNECPYTSICLPPLARYSTTSGKTLLSPHAGQTSPPEDPYV